MAPLIKPYNDALLLQVIMNHSLPSISFASGGDGVSQVYSLTAVLSSRVAFPNTAGASVNIALSLPTQITIELIGYVAKDPMHGRGRSHDSHLSSFNSPTLRTACHVFDCPSSAQFVLATIGQAFELRYKIYLKAPKPQPVQVPTEQV